MPTACDPWPGNTKARVMHVASTRRGYATGQLSCGRATPMIGIRSRIIVAAAQFPIDDLLAVLGGLDDPGERVVSRRCRCWLAFQSSLRQCRHRPWRAPTPRFGRCRRDPRTIARAGCLAMRHACCQRCRRQETSPDQCSRSTHGALPLAVSAAITPAQRFCRRRLPGADVAPRLRRAIRIVRRLLAGMAG